MDSDPNSEKITTNKLCSLSESTKICRFCLNTSGTDSIINLFGTFADELNLVKIITQHFWFKVCVNITLDFPQNIHFFIISISISQPEPSDLFCNAICTECWQKIETFHLFYTNVKIIQDKLISDQSAFSLPLSPNFIGLPIENSKIEVNNQQNNDNWKLHADPIDNASSDNDVTDTFAKPLKNTKKKLTKIKNDTSLPIKQKSTTITPSHEYDFDEDQQIRQFFLLNCDLCVPPQSSLTFNSHFDYLIHFRKVHNIDRRSIICSICKTRSLTREQIRQHICWHLNPDAYK